MGAEYLYKNYSDAGFNFSKDIISNYCLSLYTKPFVILSGISGTGKTKIAQLFQPYIEKVDEYDATKKKSLGQLGKNYITLTLTEGLLNGDGRGNFKQDDLPLFFTPEEFEKYKILRDKFKKDGNNGNFTDTYTITLIDSEKSEYDIEFYGQRASSPLIRTRFKSKLGDARQYDLQPYLRKKYKVKDIIQLEKVGEKRFRIVKTDDTEVIELEKSANIKTYENNICLIPVKSDWTDPSGIMGFYNIIEKKFHIGPFLKHLLHANENPEIPFFVILDEMNLSKIEYYFSDILSILETRMVSESGEMISREKIMLHSASSEDCIFSDDAYFETVPSKVSIPPNLYITGTINIDETTYTPSPKVLDRSNVIEFNNVNLNQYFNNIKLPDISKFVLHKIPNFSTPIVSSAKISTAIPANVKAEIININDILKKYNLHFGYRIASEISLYVSNVLEYIKDPNQDILNMALDFQISQKILPKINGTQAKIEKAILELFNSFTGAAIDLDNVNPTDIESFDASTSRYPLTVRKIKTIHGKLIAYGFASSIE